MAPWRHRLAMCRIAFSRLSTPNCDVEVSTIEEEMHAETMRPVTTIRLLERLRELEGDTEFHLCLGEDTFDSLRRGEWERADELLR